MAHAAAAEAAAFLVPMVKAEEAKEVRTLLSFLPSNRKIKELKYGACHAEIS